MAIHSIFSLPRGIMNRLMTRGFWKEMMAKLKQGFTDFAEDDMLFSEVEEIELIKQLQQQLNRSGMKTYNIESI
jgi:hypothetical protein